LTNDLGISSKLHRIKLMKVISGTLVFGGWIYHQ
jgi:hypothetical protein